MNFDFKKFVLVILSAVLAALGGNAYQTSNALNDVQKNVAQLSSTVNTIATHKLVQNEESE